MLSDCTGMIGGETMIKTGYGDYISVRGPAMVSLQMSIQPMTYLSFA